MLIFVGLVWSLIWMEQSDPGQPGDHKKLIMLAAISGTLVGLGALTRYSFGWLILPVLIFLGIYFGKKRAVLCLAALAAFLIVLTPWTARNYIRSGTAFGTAGFAVLESTSAFPSDILQRSLQPQIFYADIGQISRKFVLNTKETLRNDLPKLGGNWISAFFLVGLVVPFKSTTLSRLRVFLLLCGAVFFAVQPLGKTHLSSEVPEVNSENLLVILAPLVFVYGVSVYFILLNQMVLPFFQMRYLANGIFCLLLSAPLVWALPPRPNPLTYPPYWPPIIQTSAGWLKEKEWMMSDIPWAVAWYGHRQCAWLTANYRPDFFEINDFLKPVHALFLTRRTTDKPFFSDWMRGVGGSWERNFLLETLLRENPPAGFPLRVAAEGFWPEQLFLTDFERWKKLAN
jgi:4-amino-4-deoxy-L-arabinose transferase-like glycosyltransferase